MSFWSKIKEINNFSFKDKWFPGYVVNKVIFRVALFVVLLVFISIGSSYGWDFSSYYHVSCPVDNPAPCINPFYGATGDLCPDLMLCSIEYFNAGDVYGDDFPFIVKSFKFLIFIIFGFSLCLNHYLYNKKDFRKVRLIK